MSVINLLSLRGLLSPARRLQILVFAAGVSGAVSTQAEGFYFQNTYGLASPSNIVTFSEYSPPPNTVITNQYQAFGVTFTPNVYYSSIYNQTSGTPNITPTACVANFVQYSPPWAAFSIVFARPVTAAAFAVLTQPGTFKVTARMAGIDLPGGPATFTGGSGPNFTNNFVGFSGAIFDELWISDVVSSDAALVVDNLKFIPALINDWTNPASGRWDTSSNWSLATLPASNQTVTITNAGYKAVNIDGAPFANFPGSVTVSNLLVAAPTNGLSTLLLNYAGLGTPLKVLNDCTIGTNGTIDNFGSSFEVDGNAGGQLQIAGGAFAQVGGLTVVNAPVLVRAGSLNATNGNLTLGDVTVGTTNSVGAFNQDGGSIAAQHVTAQNGSYTMASGTLYAINGTRTTPSGVFNQQGGTNYGDITVNGGNYILGSGLAKGNVLLGTAGPAQAGGSFGMDGGILDMQQIIWTNQESWYSSAYLRYGVVRCGSFDISIAAIAVWNASVFITNTLTLRGDPGAGAPAELDSSNGDLHVANVDMFGTYYNCYFWQGGTNRVSNGVSIYGGTYVLQGRLETPYVGVGTNGNFAHEAGQNVVSGVLSITGDYNATAGSILTAGLFLRGSITLWGPPIGSGLTFTNTGLVDLGGSFGTSLPDAWGGQMRLSTNAVLNFLGSPAQTHFAPSAGNSWKPGAQLVVSGWNNSGNHVFFGTDSSGLSTSQLKQIIFSDPGGLPPGNYPAQQLPTGELVPGPRPSLQSTRNGSGLVMTWTGNYQLLSATNITGPYSPVNNASSPWTNSLTKAREFFRLQGL